MNNDTYVYIETIIYRISGANGDKTKWFEYNHIKRRFPNIMFKM